MKQLILKVSCLILLSLLCFACKVNATPVSGNENSGDSSNPTQQPVPTEPEFIISISTEFQDFKLEYDYDTQTKTYSISLVSPITFEQLNWFLNNTPLSSTGNQIEIDTNTLSKPGVYNLLVTGVNNGIVYSAEMMITAN